MSQPDWTSSTLAELAESKALVFSDGYRTRADQFASEGIPILRAADVADGILIPAHSDHIRTDFRPKIGNKTTRARDVVLTTKGTVGRAAMVPDGFPEHAYSPQLCFFRVKDTATLDAGYLYGWIRSTECRSQLFASKDLTDMAPYVNLRDLSQFRITLPPLSEQWRIAGVLSAFDDLIETDRRLAEQLDALRRARVSDALATSSVTTRLNEVASFVNGRNFTNGADGTGRPVVRTPEVRSGPGGNTVWSSVAVTDDARVARVGDILFVWSGSLMVNRWLYTDGLVNQHVFKVIPAQVPDWYVFALIEAQLPWFLGLAKDKATTMGHIQRAHLDEPMTGLDSDTIARLSPVIEPIWSAALELRLEAQELSRQRDELLPLLMSGKVKVSEVAGVD